MWIGVAAGCGLVVGEFLRRRLNLLSYRRLDDGEKPAPGPRPWVPALLAVSWAVIAGVLVPGLDGYRGVAELVGWLGFALIGLWLAAVDLDVWRLPDRGQLLLVGVLLPCGIIATTPRLTDLLIAVGAGGVCGFVLWIMHLLSRGDVGLGDVKLVMTCGFWLALGGLQAVFAGLIVACLLAVGFAAITRQRLFAFGPWLIAGTLIAGLAVG